jgi:hypothetical protein
MTGFAEFRNGLLRQSEGVRHGRDERSPTGSETLQVMITEHVVLQAARSATIQEASQRANLFLTSVSSATIALAFVAQITQMGRPFVLFRLILLPCLYFMGLVTFVRAVQVAIEYMVHARGMARIRHYYVDLAPPLRDAISSIPFTTIARRCLWIKVSSNRGCPEFC